MQRSGERNDQDHSPCIVTQAPLKEEEEEEKEKGDVTPCLVSVNICIENRCFLGQMQSDKN